MQDFIAKLQEKHALSLAKYPPSLWAELAPIQMLHALESEVDELKAALWRGDIDGPHGVRQEAVDVGNVAARIAIEMRRRSSTKR